MKTLIQLVVVALIFGGISAAATLFLQPHSTATPVAGADAESAGTTPAETVASHKPEPHAADPAGHEASGEASAEHSPSAATDNQSPPPDPEQELAAAEPPRGHSAPPSPAAESPVDGTPSPEAGATRPEARVAVRPPYTPEGDEAGSLINLLRERSRVAMETERKLVERQDAMSLIFDDLRAEQTRTLKIRQRFSGELKESRQAVDAARQAIEAERVMLQKEQSDTIKAAEDAVRTANEERDKLRKQLEQATAPPADDAGRSAAAGGSPAENVNLKKAAAVFDGMTPENVAKVFEQLVKNKQIDAVVLFMNTMKDRQTAKVLGVITDSNPQLAAELSDRLKRLKTSTEKPATEK